jgi:hypothetical protein
MLKNILNLEGVKEISKNEQKQVNGGMLPEGCYFEIISGLTQAECLAEGGRYTSAGYCRILVCEPL